MKLNRSPFVLAKRLTTTELGALIVDEQRCFDLFARWRFPHGFVCPGCLFTSAFVLRTRRLWQCRRCHKQVSVTSGTTLHRTRLPLRHWLYAIWMVANRKQSISALQLQKELGLKSYDTAWCLLHKIRRSLRWPHAQKLGGLVVVGKDTLSPRSVRTGGKAAACERAIGVVVDIVDDYEIGHARFRLESKPGQLGANLRAACGELKRLRLERRYGQDRKIVVTLLHNFQAWLQGTFHSVTFRHLPAYLDEFAYRFNHRFYEGLLIDLLGDQLLISGPVTRAELREGQPVLT